MPKGVPVNLVGQQFGEWTVRARAGTDALGKVRWDCLCTCGTSGLIPTGNLLYGKSTRCRSCGNRRSQQKTKKQ
jgi:hypothetical protein